ncbi:uncharacterized protein LOC119377287, partial [Rhipicephalus sanguineus]|uniref:uncharacterized protein LOC119377287 n=1 Tax=Rhipicephalus sanguineus TaxID=34632 RepID=UPI0020C563E9
MRLCGIVGRMRSILHALLLFLKLLLNLFHLLLKSGKGFRVNHSGTMEELQELQAEEKRLLSMDFEGGSNSPQLKETEEEMLIRTGEMTPFGSTVADSSRCTAQPSTHAAAELVCQVPPPRKRKKKECLGTVTRHRIPMASRSSQPDESVIDLEESDPEGQSDEEYLPDSLGSEEEEEDAGGNIPVKK